MFLQHQTPIQQRNPPLQIFFANAVRFIPEAAAIASTPPNIASIPPAALANPAVLAEPPSEDMGRSGRGTAGADAARGEGGMGFLLTDF
eukprot:CAMPEP_0174892102 /NCGR_PEP_ID=MMETSP0167-20121228/7123_1 /TAXON_ID=38298 /ORGANISM="Rhodella maculata, Strain CCMP736" /LENGTH=88 /DNA_ID=CAMNT_0016130499 /DNA_START=180 /DNA_END=447 /DNA_ORIENTATION=-